MFLLSAWERVVNLCVQECVGNIGFTPVDGRVKEITFYHKKITFYQSHLQITFSRNDHFLSNAREMDEMATSPGSKISKQFFGSHSFQQARDQGPSKQCFDLHGLLGNMFLLVFSQKFRFLVQLRDNIAFRKKRTLHSFNADGLAT